METPNPVAAKGQALRFGRYEAREEIGRGAMGLVFRAWDPKIGRMVALKTIHLGGSLDPEARRQYLERFYREATAAGRLSHPNIVTVYDAGEQGDIPFIALEFVPGLSLDASLTARRPLPWQEAVEILLQIAEGLDFAHEQGVVHRDIKPANILLTPEGRVKITDFGVARVAGSQLTQEAQVLGTPSYMAPEVIQGRSADRRADIFSLGCIAYELLTGSRPFPGEALTTVLYRIVHETPCPLTDYALGLPPGLQAILDTALAKAPEARYQRGADFAAALRRLRGGEGPEATRPSRSDTVVSTRPSLPDDRASTELAGLPAKSPGQAASLLLLASARNLTALARKASLAVRRLRADRRTRGAVAAIGGLLLLWGAIWAIRQTDPAVRAQRHLAEGRPEVAIAVLEEAREKAPKRAELALLLGDAYAHQGKGFQAVRAYRQATDLDPAYRHDKALSERLVAMLEQGETAGEAGELLAKMDEASVPALQEATESPRHALRWNAAGVLRRMGRKPDHVQLYLLDLKYEDCFTRKKAAQRLGELGDARALPALREAQQRSLLDNFCMFGALDDALRRLSSQ